MSLTDIAVPRYAMKPTDIAKYRHRARELRDLADRMTNVQHRTLLLGAADNYDRVLQEIAHP